MFVASYTGDRGKYCIPQCWFLDSLMLITVCELLLLALYSRSPFACKLVATALILALTIYTWVFCAENDIKVYELIRKRQAGHFNYFTHFYIRPWFRAPPSLLGFLLAISYQEYLQYQPGQKLQPLLLWAARKAQTGAAAFAAWAYGLGVALISIVVWAPVQNLNRSMAPWSDGGQYFWQSISRLLFCAGVCLLVLPSMVKDKPDAFARIMGHRAVTVLGRLTYAAHLLFYPLLKMSTANSVQTYQFSRI